MRSKATDTVRSCNLGPNLVSKNFFEKKVFENTEHTFASGFSGFRSYFLVTVYDQGN